MSTTRPHAPRPRGPRPAISRADIVAAGLAIADTEGLEAVSMRRVAQDLGVGTMTLYSHVADKGQLLDLMNDEVMAEVVVPGELPADWRAALSELARRTADSMIKHAWVAADRGRSFRIGPNALRHVEQSIAAVEHLGLEPRIAGEVLACVDDYAIGYALRTIGARQWAKATGRPDPVRPSVDDMPAELRRLLDSGEYPRLRRSLAEGNFAPAGERFEAGLRWLLDGIEAEVARSRRSRS
jgi:AcrR family transcriptional regulator